MKIKLAILISLVSASLLMGTDKGKEVYYQKCVSCHGVNGEKEAIGTSRAINTLTQEEIRSALTGYANGSYGGKYKKLKAGMARTLSKEDIDVLSVYIQTLKPQ